MKACTIKDLAKKGCVPCQGTLSALKGAALKSLLKSLGRQWKAVKGHHLEKEFKFKDFKQALDFVVEVGGLAEAQGHHPNIYLAWGRVKITLWTHKIDGLSESDFALAALIEQSR